MVSLSAEEELVLLRKRARRRLVGAAVMVLVSVSVLLKVVDSIPDQQMHPELVEITSKALTHELIKLPPSNLPMMEAKPLAASQPQTSVKDLRTKLPEPQAIATLEQHEELPERSAASEQVALSAARSDVAVPDVTVLDKKIMFPLTYFDKRSKDRPSKPDPAAILEDRVGEQDMLSVDQLTSENKVMVQLAALSDTAKADALRLRLESIGVSARFTRFTRVVTSKGPVTRVRLGPFATRQEAQIVLKKLARTGVTGMIVNQ